MLHTPGHLDIVFGRGKSIHKLPGNIRFRRVVLFHKHAYESAASDGSKGQVVRRVHDELVRGGDIPSGYIVRFLKPLGGEGRGTAPNAAAAVVGHRAGRRNSDNNQQVYEEVHQHVALKKIQHALRERRAPRLPSMMELGTVSGAQSFEQQAMERSEEVFAPHICVDEEYDSNSNNANANQRATNAGMTGSSSEEQQQEEDQRPHGAAVPPEDWQMAEDVDQFLTHRGVNGDNSKARSLFAPAVGGTTNDDRSMAMVLNSFRGGGGGGGVAGMMENTAAASIAGTFDPYNPLDAALEPTPFAESYAPNTQQQTSFTMAGAMRPNPRGSSMPFFMNSGSTSPPPQTMNSNPGAQAAMLMMMNNLARSSSPQQAGFLFAQMRSQQQQQQHFAAMAAWNFAQS